MVFGVLTEPILEWVSEDVQQTTSRRANRVLFRRDNAVEFDFSRKGVARA